MIIGKQLATYSHVPQSLASYICATIVCAKTLVSARKRLICTKLYSYSTELSTDHFLDRYSREDKTYISFIAASANLPTLLKMNILGVE
jgi:hypothetical protein